MAVHTKVMTEQDRVDFEILKVTRRVTRAATTVPLLSTRPILA